MSHQYVQPLNLAKPQLFEQSQVPPTSGHSHPSNNAAYHHSYRSMKSQKLSNKNAPINLSKPPRTTFEMESRPHDDSENLPYLDNYQTAIRNAFIRKVMGIFAFQMGLSFTIAFIMTANLGGIGAYVVTKSWVLWTSMIGSIAFSMALFCGLHSKTPLNWILLIAFTLCESILVGSCCLLVRSTDGIGTVLGALFVTTFVVGALTAWALQSKRDFSSYMGYTLVLLAAVAGAMLVQLFLRSSIIHTGITLLSGVLCGFYLLVDMQMLFRKEVNLDEYMLYAMRIYMDVIVIFIDILDLMSSDD